MCWSLLSFNINMYVYKTNAQYHWILSKIFKSKLTGGRSTLFDIHFLKLKLLILWRFFLTPQTGLPLATWPLVYFASEESIQHWMLPPKIFFTSESYRLQIKWRQLHTIITIPRFITNLLLKVLLTTWDPFLSSLIFLSFESA